MCHGQILTDAMRTARKVHKCDECGRVIERGREYVYRAGLLARSMDSYKLCKLCAVGEGIFRDSLDGEVCYYRGDVAQDMEVRAREEGWRSLLAAMRTRLTELRARYGKKRGEQPATGEGGRMKPLVLSRHIARTYRPAGGGA